MPLLALPTTIPQIQDAFRAAMEAMTPRTTRQQETSGWKYYAREHQPLQGCRWFRFEWDDQGLTPGGFMWRGGAAVDVLCSIVADYGSVPAEHLDGLAHDDHQQLGDLLDMLRTTTDGLRRVRSASWAQEAGTSADQAQIVHQFLVTYLQTKFTS